jgi:L-threonylcarbamoyladenylate synthase
VDIISTVGEVRVADNMRRKAEAAARIASREFTDAALEAAPTTPGMKYRHYSPAAPLTLVEVPGGWGARHASLQGGEEQQQQQREEQRQCQQQEEGQEEGQEQGGAAGEGTCHEAAVAAASAAAAAELAACGCGCIALLRTTLPDGTPVGWLQRRGEDGGGGGGAVREYCLGPMRRPAEVARALFAALRDAEAAGAGAIVAEGVPDGGEGAAVMNRLRKAASSVRRAPWGGGAP